MGKVKAYLSRGYAVAALACLACAWPRPSFPAGLASPSPLTPSTTTPSTTSTGDPALDSEPDAAVDFSGKAPVEVKPESKNAEGAATESPDKKSIFSSLHLAPIRFMVGGSVGYMISRQTSGSQPAVVQQGLNTGVNVMASSYIWQPWMATVNGAASYMNSLLISSAGGSGSGVPNSSVSGNAELRIFPYSRYPFAAGVSQGESYTGYGIGAPNTQNTVFKLSQSYTPWHRVEQYAAGLTRQINGGLGLPKSREDALDFRASTMRFSKQNHSVDGASSLLHLPLTGTILNNRLVSSHSYTPDSSLALNANGNANYTNAHVGQSVTKNALLQLSGFASWRPAGAPYYVVSAIRGLGMNASAEKGQAPANRNTSRAVFTNASAVYTVNRYINLNASANYATQDSNGKRTQSGSFASNQAASYSYPLPSINFGDLRYSRSIGGSFTNRNSTQPGVHTVQALSVNPSHQLTRRMGWMGGSLGLGINQSLGMSKASRSPESASLSHSGSANWNHSAGTRTSMVSLSGSDMRTLLGEQTASQMINLQAGLNMELDHNSTLSGNLTMQTARSGKVQAMSPFVSSSSANLSYQNQRMFNISRMNFKSDLRMSSKSLMPVPQLAGAKTEPALYWTNSLNYSLGRLQMHLQGDLAQVQNAVSTTIMFSVTRSFGGGR